MVDVDDILRTAIEKDASDVHLISGIRPMLRIARHLTPYEGCDNLTPEDMADIYFSPVISPVISSTLSYESIASA